MEHYTPRECTELRPLLGYGAGTTDIATPLVEWNGCDTEIQITGVNNDLGIHDDPDTFYTATGTNLPGLKGLLYRGIVHHVMNRTVQDRWPG